MDGWTVIRGWAVVAIVTHSLLIPLCFLGLLFSQRQKLAAHQPSELLLALRWLHAPYTPESYFWEFVESANKLLLVGVARIAWPGTTQ